MVPGVSGRAGEAVAKQMARLALASRGARSLGLFAAAIWLGTVVRAAEVLSPEEEAELRARSAPPAIECSPLELSATVEAGATTTLSLAIRNAGGGKLSWAASFAPAWAKAVPERGELSYGERREVVIAVDASGLAPGVTRGDIIIDAPGSRGGPAKISISLNVKPRPGTPTGGPAAPAEPGPAAGTGTASRVVPLPKRLRYSIGVGYHFVPGIAYTQSGTGPDDHVNLAEPFGFLSWQKGAFEFGITSGISQEGERIDFGGGEFLVKNATEDVTLRLRLYSKKEARSRAFFELGYGWMRVELETESMSSHDSPPSYVVGFGARKFYSHGFFDFSLDLWGALDPLPLYEAHSSGWTRTWDMGTPTGILAFALGLSF